MTFNPSNKETQVTITEAMVEAAAKAICQREEFNTRNWANYQVHAKMALNAAIEVA